MPLDASAYSLALLRLDGRRWNELRRINAQISTQAASDGSSYLEMGNTKILCTVIGPVEGRKTAGASSQANQDVDVKVDINIAGFSGLDRRKKGRTDKRSAELQALISESLSSTLFKHLFTHSQLAITLHVLSQDGSLLAASINAATLALVDAGIPMRDYLIACTAGITAPSDDADPLLDLNSSEEQELPFLTVATVGSSEKISLLAIDSKMQPERLESMLAVGVDGCKQVKEVLDQIIRNHGLRVVEQE